MSSSAASPTSEPRPSGQKVEAGQPRLEVIEVGVKDAAMVLQVVRAAFADRPVLDPPADALTETLDSMEKRLRFGGGLVATLDEEPVGALVLDPDEKGIVWLRRFGVVPGVQGRGIAAALINAAARAASGRRGLGIFAREELPKTVAFWARQGFAEVDRHTPYVEMIRSLPQEYAAESAGRMRELGRLLAGRLKPGDLVLLTGELGAGKTTFTQGLGDGLGVRGGVTSPTFVISRVHPSLGHGPELVHVDAYRLHGLAELDDLDLDTSLEEAVTVVEWGSGVAEALAESRLEVTIRRSTAMSYLADDADALDPRVVRVQGYGPRWTFLGRLPF